MGAVWCFKQKESKHTQKPALFCSWLSRVLTSALKSSSIPFSSAPLTSRRTVFFLPITLITPLSDTQSISPHKTNTGRGNNSWRTRHVRAIFHDKCLSIFAQFVSPVATGNRDCVSGTNFNQISRRGANNSAKGRKQRRQELGSLKKKMKGFAKL